MIPPDTFLKKNPVPVPVTVEQSKVLSVVIVIGFSYLYFLIYTSLLNMDHRLETTSFFFFLVCPKYFSILYMDTMIFAVLQEKMHFHLNVVAFQ